MSSSPTHRDALKEPRSVPVNLSVDTEVLAEARALSIPLSATFEAALRARVREVRHERWHAENEAAIREFNARVAECGTYSDEHRRF